MSQNVHHKSKKHLKRRPAMKFTAILSCLGATHAFVVRPQVNPAFPRTASCCHASFSTSGLWNAGLNFGKGEFRFYRSFDDFMSPFPKEDRDAYPEIFTLPEGVYEVSLSKPLGIIFEEINVGKGVYVQDLVEGGNAERQGVIQKNDVLVGIRATKIVGAKWECRMIPARRFDFDTVVGAIVSNDPKWGCDNVILMFERPGEADSSKTDAFLEFFEPPFDNPWKQAQ
jgi:hypothetical protein